MIESTEGTVGCDPDASDSSRSTWFSGTEVASISGSEVNTFLFMVPLLVGSAIGQGKVKKLTMFQRLLLIMTRF